jgi:hypothetical protein
MVTVSDERDRRAATGPASWTKNYLRRAAVADLATAAVCSTLAVQLRFDGHITPKYAVLSLTFPILWTAVLWLSGAYDDRFIGTGPDEFRKVLNTGVSLTAGLAIVSYAVNTELSRAYLLLTMPSVTALDLTARYAMRKRLHKQRAAGRCMSTVLAADTVAILPSSEIDGRALRHLAWELEKTGTNLCVAPALLDVAGPCTTLRPTAGLTLLHVDHPQLSGPRQALKGIFDRITAATALIMLSPLGLLMADPPVTYAEISDQLGLPVGSIRPTRGRSPAKLRTPLKPHEDP